MDKIYGRWSKSISVVDKVCTCQGELEFITVNMPHTLTGHQESRLRSANPSPRRQLRPGVIELTCNTDVEVEELTLGVDSLDLAINQ